MNRRSFILSTSTLALASVAHGDSSTPKEPTVIFAKGDTSRKATASVGDVLTVKIPCNPSTGYRWDIAKMTEGKIVEDGKSKFEEIEGDKPKNPEDIRIGSPCYQVFRFKVSGPGVIELEYKRPFDEKANAARVARVEVEIKP